MFEDNYFFEESKNSIIKITGSDKFKFLQGIISNDIYLLKNKTSIYSAILSPQGKFISDFIISTHDDNFYIEINNNNLEEILTKFSLFKLKSNVSFKVIENAKIILSNMNFINIIKNHAKAFFDPRFNEFFTRIYLFESNIKFKSNKIKTHKLTEKEFKELRLRHGIPDFQVDKISNKSFLMEMRFDKLNGLSWDKGCYLGQEVTARMYYRKKISKKIFQIKINLNTNIEDKVLFDDDEVGVITSHDNKNGFAYLDNKLSKKFDKKKLRSGDSIISFMEPWWSK